MDNKIKNTIRENFKNTELGFLRIKRNLGIESYSNNKTGKYLKEIIQSTPNENIEKKGKNFYFNNKENNIVLTINKNTLTIITAKFISKNS